MLCYWASYGSCCPSVHNCCGCMLNNCSTLSPFGSNNQLFRDTGNHAGSRLRPTLALTVTRSLSRSHSLARARMRGTPMDIDTSCPRWTTRDNHWMLTTRQLEWLHFPCPCDKLRALARRSAWPFPLKHSQSSTASNPCWKLSLGQDWASFFAGGGLRKTA